MDYSSFQPGGQNQSTLLPKVPKTENLSERLRPYQWRIAIIGGIIIALLFGAYSYSKYLVQQSNDALAKQAQDAQKKIDEIRQKRAQNSTADWKTYNDTLDGFELHYPNDWFSGVTPSKGEAIYEVRNFSKYQEGGVLPKGGLVVSFKKGCELNVDANGYLVDDYGMYKQLSRSFCKSGFQVFFDLDIGASLQDKNLLETISNSLTSTLDTSTWKTYTNTQYGFEFKYPSDWTFSDKNLSASSTGNLFSLEKYGPAQTPQSLSFDDGAIIGVGITGVNRKIYDFSNNEITPDKWTEYISSGLGGDKIDDLPITTNGFVGKANVVYNNKNLSIPVGEMGGVYRILPSGSILLISWQRMNLYENDLSYEKYLLPILSTFKFTK